MQRSFYHDEKTTFGAALAFLFAAAGALTAAALYLHHREKELDEYERLLFSDDYDDFDDEDDTDARTPPPTRRSPTPQHRGVIPIGSCVTEYEPAGR